MRGNVLFLCSARKVPKEGDLGGHSEKACPPKSPLRRLADRPPKMFRFSGVYREKTCKILSGRWSKIGTFLATGWRCGGGFLRGRLFEAPLKPASFGSFLAGQEKNIPAPSWIAKKYKFLLPAKAAAKGSYSSNSIPSTRSSVKAGCP